jgi:two-component system invasion response regulator UvrY
MIKILIISRSLLVRKGLIALLTQESDLRVIGEASQEQETTLQLKRTQPSIILLDLLMQEEDGVTILKKIFRAYAKAKVLILAVHESDVYPQRLLKEGLLGYLTHRNSPQELMQAIRTIHQGEHYISPMVAQRLAVKRCIETFRESPFEGLSRRELQVAQLISSGKKTTEITTQLHLSHKTINTYRYRLYEKLHVHSDVALTLLALSYHLIEPPIAISNKNN